MLLEVRRHNQKNELQISTIACPGLGAGVGNTPPDEVARQMSLAYRHFLSPPKSITWEMADARQIQIRYGGYIGFRIPPGK